MDAVSGYGADGDLHWSYEKVKQWWSRRKELESFLKEESKREPSSGWDWQDSYAIRRWQQYIQDGVYDYLRVYAFFLEEKRIPKEGELLPNL